MKHTHRFFVTENLSSGKTACLDADDSFHAARVLRLRAGDRIELAGADGRVFTAEVIRVDGRVEARAVDEVDGRGRLWARADLVIVQALPKGKKMDLVVEKLSELGVARLVPAYSEKSVVRPSGGSDGRMERWLRVARAAAGQCRRERVMAIDEPLPLGEWLDGRPAGGPGNLIVLATETEGALLGAAIEAFLDAAPAEGHTSGQMREMTILVGPESGFSPEEIKILSTGGAMFATLGPLLLRTETAAMAAAAIAMHRLGAIG